MRAKYAMLTCIENNRKICQETDSEFLYHLQHALLLALREKESISPMQHRHAEEKLKKQRREQAMRKQEEP